MAVGTRKKLSQGAFYAKVDKAFYDSCRDENGNLAPDLVDANGNPRKLTMSPKDRAYRKRWLKLRDQMKKSKAVPKKKVTGGCVECQLKAEAARIAKIKASQKKNGAMKTIEPKQRPVARAKEHKQQNKVPCKHQHLTVTCDGHNHKRGFNLDLPGDPTAPDPPPDVLEVIDDGTEVIICTTKIVGGVCPQHNCKVFDITPTDAHPKVSNTQAVFDVAHDLTFLNSNLVDYINPWHDFPPVTYAVRTQTCHQEQPLSATIQVYPQVDWDGEIKIGRKDTVYAEKVDLDNDAYPPDLDATRYEDSSKLVITGNAWITVRGKKVVEVRRELTGKLSSILKIADLLFKAMEAADKITETFGGVKIEFYLPTLKLSGNWGRKEVHGSPKTARGITLGVEFSPLIGAGIQVDVLNALLAMAEPVGPAIIRVKKMADRAGVQIQIPFKVKGEIKGGFKYKKTEAEEHGHISADIGGRLTITLELFSKIEKKFWGVLKVGTEARAAATTRVSSKVDFDSDDNGVYAKGSIKMDGLMLYGVIAATAKVNTDSPPDDFEKRSQLSTDDTDVSQPDYGGVISEGKGDSNSVGGKVGLKFSHTFWRDKYLFHTDKSDKHYIFGN
jgi:hypothetical protein